MKRKQRTTAEFIQDSKVLHGEMYDYSLVTYKRIDAKVIIVCSLHGQFEQTPHSHLIYKSGCPECARDQRSGNIVTFIRKSTQVHGDKYDYSTVNYINNNTKVIITCPIHGLFSQLPTNHISRGSGCPECGNIDRGHSNKLKFHEVVSKANDVHNNKYFYIEEGYTNVSGKLKIVCPEHGLFVQRPTNHIYMTQGCPQCADYGVYTKHYFNERPHMKDVDAILYLISLTSGSEQFYKIGITRRSVEQRFQTIKGYNYEKLYSWSKTLFEVFEIEQLILTEFSTYKFSPANKIGGDSECFNLDTRELDHMLTRIRQLL